MIRTKTVSRRATFPRLTLLILAFAAASGGRADELHARRAAGRGGPSAEGAAGSKANAPAELSGAAADAATSLGRTKPLHIFIELSGESAAEVYARRLDRAKAEGLRDPKGAAGSASKAQFDQNREMQEYIALRLEEEKTRAEPTVFLRRAINGIGAMAAPDKIEAIGELPGVKRVLPVAKAEFLSKHGIAFLGVPQFWQMTGHTGDGIRMALIDLGIDYTHTAFGGSGSLSEYQSNDETIIGDIPGFPGVRVIGGIDFTGDDWDGTNLEVVDPDPMDCHGHGTAIGSVMAGSGVLLDGMTYIGPYDASVSVDNFKIPPGMAPEALIYAIKIGGCINITTSLLIAQGIDWALDPNNDGNLSDRVDVMNLSVRTEYGSPLDPASIAAENASRAGAILVAGAGNDGDQFYILGSPASSPRTIAAAATVDDGILNYNLQVNSPPSIAGNYEAGPAAFGPLITETGMTGELSYEANLNACFPFANANLYTGKIALLDFDDCDAPTQAAHAQAAGAIGVIFIHPSSDFAFGPTGYALLTIPVAMIGASDGAAIRDALAMGPVNVTLSSATTYPHPEFIDVSPSFTSRGPARDGSALKPDISAPGYQVVYAQTGSGMFSSFTSGTSLSTAFVSGAAALMRELHPDWTVEEIKAVLMNTALHDVYDGTFGSQPPNYVTLAGAGRMDILQALDAGVVAYCANGPGAVSVSFGAPEFVTPGSLLRVLRVLNKGNDAVSFTASAARVTTPPGVQFSIEAPATIDVPAQGSVDFNVRLTADPALMKHVPDPHLDLAPLGFSRAWITEVSGFIELSSATHGTLRVPVHAVVRPAGLMSAVEPDLDLPTMPGPFNVILSGIEVNGGPAQPNDVLGLVMPFELQYSSEDDKNLSVDDAEILHAGVRRIPRPGGIADADLVFGVALRGSNPHPENLRVRVFVDVNEDEIDDYMIFNSAPDGVHDAPRAYVMRLSDSTFGLNYPLNGLDPSAFDTVVMNNDVMELFARAGNIALSDVDSRFNYRIHVESRDAQLALVDATPTMTYDPAAPGMDFVNYFYFDVNGNFIDVAFDPAAFATNGSLGLLLLHHHNAEGHRAEALLPHENTVRRWSTFE